MEKYDNTHLLELTEQDLQISGGNPLGMALTIYATVLAAAYGLGYYNGVQDREANKKINLMKVCQNIK